jgi:demethylmenaquinone methyltransferase/2-methoxy-6-polyprenyl-1,4-benzoquinol methylase
VAGRTEQLPFRAGSFARVVMVDALHHLADQEASLAELWRIVEPGGRIVIEEPDISRLAVRLVAFFERLARMRSRFLPAATIAAMARRQGAQTSTHRRNHTVWVVVDKMIDKGENAPSSESQP